ncbi:leucine-rich repeat domain-containing protein [Anatilimnocola sp. NA78]|uniref:leucine-rich repeat domain-containing protein n=1 Tax=Anatilimnocola sp. NA78 TaxID=3415683 RepID=UPI003CE4B533
MSFTRLPSQLMQLHRRSLPFLLAVVCAASCSPREKQQRSPVQIAGADKAAPIPNFLPAEMETRADMARKNLSFKAALTANKGDFAAALQAIGLEVEVDDQGEVTRIIDAMLRGSLNDEEFALLAQMPKLEDIWLRGAKITDDGLAALEKMPRLKRLSLAAENLTDRGLIHLRHLPELTTLHLEETKITGSGLVHIPNPQLLTWVGFTDSPLTDEGLKQVGAFSQMTTLGLWGTKVTDAGLPHLKRCQQLQRLSLYRTAITNDGLKLLTELPQLKNLQLSETKVNDAGLPLLLALPHLKEVEFGSEQIEVATLEKLVAAGIEVRHGQLLNVRRTENLLRYVGMDFEVDTEASSLVAYVEVGNPNVGYRLEIQCTDRYVPDHMQPAHLEGPPFGFNKGWQALVGEQFKVSFKKGELHPVLPDNPCNIYVGWHAAPDDHRIEFQQRNGNRFLIDWHCDARESEDDDPVPVWVSAEIPFTEVRLISASKLTPELANSEAAKHFKLAEFEAPEVENNEHFHRATFRVKATSDRH